MLHTGAFQTSGTLVDTLTFKICGSHDSSFDLSSRFIPSVCQPRSNNLTSKPLRFQTLCAAPSKAKQWVPRPKKSKKPSEKPVSSPLLQDTRQRLDDKGRRAKRWLGQHYTVDETVLVRVVEVAQVQAGDLVVEIGPGTGALTAGLLAAGAHVVAVEKDPDMAAVIREKFPEHERLEVINLDVLKWPMARDIRGLLEAHAGREEAAPAGSATRRVKVVSNLPFNITSDFLKRALPLGDLISDIVLMVQEEAARRLLQSSPGDDQYRVMSLFVQFFSTPKYHFKVGRASFFPRPNVDGAVVSFGLRAPDDYALVSAPPAAFFGMVRSAFVAKRKLLRNSLRHTHAEGPAGIEATLSALEIPLTATAIDMSLNDFIRIFHALQGAKTEGVGAPAGLAPSPPSPTIDPPSSPESTIIDPVLA